MRLIFLGGILLGFVFKGDCGPVTEDLAAVYGGFDDDADPNIQNDNHNAEYYDDVNEGGKPNKNTPDDDTPMAKIDSPPQMITANVNDTVTFPCKTDSAGVVLIWYKNDTPLFQQNTSLHAKPNNLILHDWSLQISPVEADDEGSYICKAMVSRSNKDQVVHHLAVKVPPKIVLIEAKGDITTLQAGATLELHCKAKGNPPPKISWHLDKDNFRLEGETLTIQHIKHKQQGLYRCLADNGVGNPDHASINIHVSHKPYVSIEKYTVNSDTNMDTELKCTVHATPKATVTWKKNGRNVVPSEHIEMHDSGADHTLIIKGLEESDFGNYSCYAVNVIGKTEKTIALVKTPAMLDFIKPERTVKDVVLTWAVESKNPIIEHELQYRKKGSSTWETAKPNVTNAEDDIYTIQYTLKDLSAGVYESRARSRNTHGWSEYTQIVPFQGETTQPQEEQELPPPEEHGAMPKEAPDAPVGASSPSSSSRIFASSYSIVLMVLILCLRH